MSAAPLEIPSRLARPRGSILAVLGGGLIVLALAAPFLSLAHSAAQGSEILPHLLAYVLPQALRETALLLAGVAIVVLGVGTGTAWLVAAYDFPGRRLLEWALVLPLAVPTYIIAYAYLDLLHPIGPVQTGLRALFGIANPRDLPFPEVRSLPVCAALLGFVLYPYVYLPTRALFLMQGANVLEVARTLGAGPARVFFRVALPLARPAVAIGATLALLEALNDIGASEFLGVRTLTVSIYTTWVNRSDLPGASQIALAMLAVVGAFILLEGWARRHSRQTASARAPARRPLRGLAAAAAFAAGFLPVAIGFLAPAGHLVVESAKRIAFAGLSPRLLDETLNTVLLSGAATLLTVAIGLALAIGVRFNPSERARALLRMAGLGYAVPGTVLAVSLLAPLSALDAGLATLVELVTGLSMGTLVLGSSVALIYAYCVRFMAIAVGSSDAGLAKIPPNLDAASRVLGHGKLSTVWRIHLPLAAPAIASGALLVFVDCMKELPATLLLRPLNVETLATHLYGEAARGTYEDGAVAALIIVAVGMLPLILVSRLQTRR
ncbi:ABC transporter permease [Enterovirga rhinocerotis]|uniref:Iron(III) transport system permease protein n=1 Tax=Enterovirga rhinocerotis TaxID=1339210 RepID=A0A4R7C4N8_9HYPH|nr:iron ABC transporter permease [Enterovirga rhinocerotis]TDR93348.1 iron(III) transport system permease protein [Enterovirga rhinocerotis]